MSKNIFLYLQSKDNFCWWQDDEIIFDREEELRFISKKKQLIVILPLDGFTCLPLEINAKNETQLMAAVPYSLEEKLLNPVEQLHFAIEPKVKNPRGVWVNDQENMLEWQQILKDLKLNADYLVPESALINPNKNDYWFWIEDDKIVYCENFSTIKINPDDLVLFLTNIENTIKQLDNKSVPRSEDEDSIKLNPDTTIEITGINFAADFEIENYPALVNLDNKKNQSPLLELSANFSSKTAVNLLQGKFKEESQTIIFFKHWTTPVVLALSTFLIYIVPMFINNFKLEQEIANFNNQINQQYLQAFPKDKTVNAEQQMRQKLKTYYKLSHENQKLTKVLDMVSENLLSNRKEDFIRTIQYEKDILTITFSLPKSAEDFDRLVTKLKSLNVKVIPTTIVSPYKHYIKITFSRK